MKTLSRQPVGTPHTDIRPEVQLLLYFSRTKLDSETAERAKALLQQESINWEHLIQLADQHGVMSLLWQNLSSTCLEAVPSAVQTHLQRNYQVQSIRNLFLTGELCKLLDLLKSHGISAIPFKGPVLAAMAYGNTALRRFCDLDILVHERDFRKTRDLLLTYDYNPVVQPWFLNEAQETAYLESRNEYTLLRQDAMVSIDLHRRLAAGDFFLLPLDFERLWSFETLSKRLKPTSVAGRNLASLLPEDVLLYLCVHGSKHLWARLAWICDVAELIRSHPNLDWGWVFRQAESVGCERMLSVGLLLANELLDAPIPDEVRRKAEINPRNKSLVSQVQTWLFRDAGAPRKGFSLERVSFHVHEIEALQGKMEYCYRSLGHYGLAPVRRAITPTYKDRLFLQLPISLSPLYYFVRPVRLVRDFGRVMWHRRSKA